MLSGSIFVGKSVFAPSWRPWMGPAPSLGRPLRGCWQALRGHDLVDIGDMVLARGLTLGCGWVDVVHSFGGDPCGDVHRLLLPGLKRPGGECRDECVDGVADGPG